MVGPQFPDSFARNVAVTLQGMGCQVTAVEGCRVRHHGRRLPNLFWRYLPKVFPALERATFKEVVRTAAAVQPDLVLVTYGFMPPEVVRDVKRVSSAKVVFAVHRLDHEPAPAILSCRGVRRRFPQGAVPGARFPGRSLG